MQDLVIPKAEIRIALSGDLVALENILLNSQFNAATCLYIYTEAAHAVSGYKAAAVKLLSRGQFNNEAVRFYHSSLTLLGQMKMNPLLGSDNGYDQKAGLACIEEAAKAGNPWAQYLAANCYRVGTACAIDKEKAQRYYLRAVRILHDKQRIQDECVQLIANGRALQPFRHYLEHMVFAQNPAGLAGLHVGNSALLKEFVCITYSNESSIYTEDLKLTYATALCPLVDVDAENNGSFLFAWGMMNAELADRKLIRKEMIEFETAYQFARNCLERMTQINSQPNQVAILGKKLLRVSYNIIEQTTDFTHPKKGALGLIELQKIASDAVGLFLFAKLLLQYNTDDIFMNRKDKFRIILHYLSKIEVQDRNQCEGYNDFLLMTIAQLIGVQTSNCATVLMDILIVKFDAIASVILGHPVLFPIQDGRILYTPAMETKLVELEANHAKLVARFTTANLKSFEYFMYKSYCDHKAELDVVFLINKLKTKLRAQLELAAAPSDDLEIILGDHQLVRAREFGRQQRELKTAQTPCALALRAIEKAVPDYEGAKKTHDYQLMAWIKSKNDAKRSDDAKQFFNACKLLYNEVDLMSTIVKHITEEQGRFNPESFKTFLLRNLAEALNFGNIRLLDTDPAQFSLYFCDTLRQLYIAPLADAPAETDGLNLLRAQAIDNLLPLGPAAPLPLASEDTAPPPPPVLGNIFH